MTPQRVTLITLGVADMERSKRFYAALGWQPHPASQEAVTFYQMNGAVLGLFGMSDLAADQGRPGAALGTGAMTLAQNFATEAEVDAAIALASAHAPDLVALDAAQFVEQQLALPQQVGVTRVLFHTVMWQYLPVATREAITAMMEAAGAQATADVPLAWISLETNRASFRHECRVRYWPGGAEATLLGEAHPHGAWVEWRAPA